MIRKTSVALILVALLMVLSVPAFATGSTFVDVVDPETAENVEVLQMMDVINGVSGNRFEPNGTLTRAQFTKMAVMIMGKGDEVSSYKSYTIFPDVKSSHWAAGYVNLAVRGEEKFISGYANGTFGPDEKITFGQAVTILMRLLGYTDSDVGMVWPTGYLNAAASAGLTDGVSLGGNSVITRAQAAKLFVNLLNTTVKDGSQNFGKSVASDAVEDEILISASETADDGSKAIETSDGEVKLAGNHAPMLLQGKRGTLLLNSKKEAWAFVPSTVGSEKNITVSSAKSGTIVDRDGEEYTLTADVKAYYKGDETKYGEIFVNLRSGTRVTLHFGLTGKVEGVYVADTSDEDAIVVDGDGNGGRLAALTGGRTDYTIRRHGEVVKASALRAYDVATYIPGENEIQISTLRVTGHYDYAYPNTDAPTRIKVLGHEFDVLPSAVRSLSSYELGDQVTLLLTQDHNVAGAAEPKKIGSDSVGIARMNGDEVTVTLMEGLTLTGKPENSSENYEGMLVSVSSYRRDYLSLHAVRENNRRSTLDVAKKTVGDAALSADVMIFERVKTGPVAEIDLEDIRLDEVSSNKILYSRYNDNGKIDLLVLDNVTGDRYIYGIASVGRYQDDDDDGPTVRTKMMTITAPDASLKEKKVGPYLSSTLSTGDWGGVVPAQGEENKAVSYIKLTELRNVTNEAWESEDRVFFDKQSYAVSDDVICYNNTTGRWIGLGEARAFGDDMTLYVDDFHVVRGVEVG